MGKPNLEGLRASISHRFSKGEMDLLDIIALIVGAGVMLWLQPEFANPYGRYTPIWERAVVGAVGFVLAATLVYSIWYLPQLAIAFLKQYWWIVLLGCSGLVGWLAYSGS